MTDCLMVAESGCLDGDAFSHALHRQRVDQLDRERRVARVRDLHWYLKSRRRRHAAAPVSAGLPPA